MSTAVGTGAEVPAELLDAIGADAGDTGIDWARTWLAEHGLPNPKAEAWRYTPLSDIERVLTSARPTGDAAATTENPGAGTLDNSTLDESAPRYGAVRLVFVNGRYSEELSDSPADPELAAPLPPGVRVGPLSDLAGSRHGNASELLGRWAEPHPEGLGPDDGFRVLNALGHPDPAVVTVSPGVAVGSPVNIVHVRTAGSGEHVPLSQPLTLIDVGPGASCRVIETHVALGAGITNALTRIRVGVDAHLHHVRVQDDHRDATHVGDTVVEQHRGAHLESISVNLGAGSGRLGIDVALCGEHATADLSGLALLAGTQRLDTVLKVDHRVPDCTSSQNFRAIVDDRARSSFCGHVLVDHGAIGTNSAQSSRNLLLSRTAQADTRPWLEILADDVKCSHGATVGRLDDTALFYMRSRGIPHDRAESMLIGAFAAQVVDDVDPPRLREALRGRVDALEHGAQGT
ncbi:MAG: Fe-S cluster assembly protein SufD [Microthrixaceae bacterium]